MHCKNHAYLQFACSVSLRSDFGCTAAAAAAVVVFVVGVEWLLLLLATAVAASVEHIAEMSDDSASVAAAAVVVTEVGVAAAVDADVLVVDKRIGSVESCQFHCYPGSHPIQNTNKRTCIKQFILVINSVTYCS